jgi:hypothetical protein
MALMRRRRSSTSASRDVACSSCRRARDDRRARSTTASSGTRRCGPWVPATIREGMWPARYQDRSVERATPAALDASCSVTHPSSWGCSASWEIRRSQSTEAWAVSSAPPPGEGSTSSEDGPGAGGCRGVTVHNPIT